VQALGIGEACLSGIWLVRPHVQDIHQVLHGRAHVVEEMSPENVSPVLFDFGDSVAGVVKRLAAAGGGKDQLRSPVGGIRAALEITQPLQIADEFRGGGQAQLPGSPGP